VLINPDRKIDFDVPSPRPFTHVIALLRLGRDEIWMDPSSPVLAFRMLPYPLRGTQGLVIPPDGLPHFEKTPESVLVPSTWSEEVIGEVAENGTLDATVRIVARGDAELSIREAFVGPVPSVWPLTVRGIVKGIDRKADEVTDVVISDPTATNEPFTASFRIKKPIFIPVWEKEWAVTLPFSDFHLPSVEGDYKGGAEWRRADSIELGQPSKFSYSIRVRLKQKFTPNVPPPLTLTREYALYQAAYNFQGDLLSAERKLVTIDKELPMAASNDYDNFRQQVLSDLNGKLKIRIADRDSSAGNP
jgi:hypothetical protein